MSNHDYPATPVEFLTLALGTFRLVRLIGVDDFPPIKSVRDRLVKRFGEDHLIVEVASCPWCASVWLGAGVVLAARRPWARRVMLIPALSAATGLLSNLDHE